VSTTHTRDASGRFANHTTIDTGTVVPTVPAAVLAHDHDTTQACPECVAAMHCGYWPVEIDSDDYDGGWHRAAAARRAQRHRADRRAAAAAKAAQ